MSPEPGGVAPDHAVMTGDHPRVAVPTRPRPDVPRPEEPRADAPCVDAPCAPVLDVDRWYYRYGYIAGARWLARYHRTRVEGTLPAGPCIYVAHHGAGYLNLDLAAACYVLGWAGWYERRTPHRPLRIVAAQGHALERALPGLAAVKRHVGLIAPDARSCLAALDRGEQLLITPGGRREATPAGRAYRLRWADRAGYVRLALTAGIPIVPLAVMGGFAAYPGLTWGKRALWSPIPLPVRLDIAIGRPIRVARRPERARDPGTVVPIHHAAWAATQALYDELCTRRRRRVGRGSWERPS